MCTHCARVERGGLFSHSAHRLHLLSSASWFKGFNPAERFQCHLLNAEMSFRHPAVLHADVSILFSGCHSKNLLILISCSLCSWITSLPHAHILQQTCELALETFGIGSLNKQAQGPIRHDVTFKVLFILYIQYTSQKYTVNLQPRALRSTIKSASGNQIFRWRLQSEKHVSSSSPCFYIVQMIQSTSDARNDNNRGLDDIKYFPFLISQLAVGCQILAKLDIVPDRSGFTARFSQSLLDIHLDVKERDQEVLT